MGGRNWTKLSIVGVSHNPSRPKNWCFYNSRNFGGQNHSGPKGTNTEWNSEPLKILEKLRVLSRNWTYDFKKDRNNLSYDRILNF